MSSEIGNITKFYLFIAQNFGSADEMVSAMDSDKDGHLIKHEFSEYMKENWSGNYTQDELSQFWHKFDTMQSGYLSGGKDLRNLNALDKNELAKLNAQLEVYEYLNEYIKNLKAPKFDPPINEGKFISAVKNDILFKVMEFVETSYDTADFAKALKEFVDETGAKSQLTIAADMYSQVYLLKAVRDKFPGIEYLGDDDIQAIITSYVESGEYDMASIEKEVQRIIDAYVSTATPDLVILDGDFAKYNYDQSNGLNGLQTKVLTTLINNYTTPDIAEFPTLRREFNEVQRAFREYFLNSNPSEFGNTREGVQSNNDSRWFVQYLENPSLILQEFRNFEPYKRLALRRDVVAAYSDISSPYKPENNGSAVVGSNNGGNNESQNSREARYKMLGQQLYIKIALIPRYSEGFADYLAENDTNWSAYQNIVREVSMLAYNGELKTDAEIQNAILERLSSLYEEFLIRTNIELDDSTWDGLPNNVTLYKHDGNTFRIVPVFNQDIDEDRITYSFDASEELLRQNCVSFPDQTQPNWLWYNSGDLPAGDYNFTVNVKVDGKVVGSRTVTMHCLGEYRNVMVETANSGNSNNLEWACSSGAGYIRQVIKNYSIMAHVNNYALIPNETKEKAINTLINYYTAMANAGMTSTYENDTFVSHTISFTYFNEMTNEYVNETATYVSGAGYSIGDDFQEGLMAQQPNSSGFCIANHLYDGPQPGTYDVNTGTWNGASNSFRTYILLNSLRAKLKELLEQ